MKTMDKYLLWAIAYIVIWSIAFFIAWLVKDNEPTILEGCILAPGVLEMLACAYIKRGKVENGEPEGEEHDEGTTDPEDNQ